MKSYFSPSPQPGPILPSPALVQFLVLALALIRAALDPAPLAAEGELVRALKSRETFYASAEAQKTRANWLTLIKEFEDAALAQDNPRHASRARYLGADLALDSASQFKQKADYEKADQLARRAVRDCPRCPHAPDAQIISGRALAGLNQLDQAVKQLMKVELNYPDSPEVAKARKLLAQLRGGPPPSPGAKVEKSPAETKTAKAPEAGQPGPKPTPKNEPSSPSEAPPAKPAQGTKIPAPPKARADGLAQVYFITLEDRGGHSTVTAYLDKVSPYVYNLIPPARSGGTFRAYADLKNTVIAPGTRIQLPNRTKLVSLAKMNQYKNDVVRLVVDMPEAHPYRPTFLNSPPRLVFQVAREAKNLPDPQTEVQPDPPESPAPPPAPVQAKKSSKTPGKGSDICPADSLVCQLGLKVKTIVIDPGHGGKDSGAAGFGLKEKDIVLKLAKKLAVRIETQLGKTVHLTRSEDRFITLERRTKIAKEKGADLFISLHVNANTLDSVEGFETYILNFATDRSAMAVAARENAESDKSVAELQDLLQIIAKNTKIAESRALAQALHKSALTSLNKKYKVRDLGVKEAPFYVLVGTDVPSVLIEIGFLTNQADADRLAQEAYLDQIVEGLVRGLQLYVGPKK